MRRAGCFALVCLMGFWFSVAGHAATLTAQPVVRGAGATYATSLPPLQQCAPGAVYLCGQLVAVPFVMPVGETVDLALSAPYKNEAFTVVCADFASGPAYEIPNADAFRCEAPHCGDGTVELCGQSVAVPGDTAIGGDVTVAVPIGNLVNGSQAAPPTFTARCDNPDAPAYHVTDASAVSCNAFPCAASVVSLCGAAIPVQGGAAMGQVLNLAMPAPYRPDPFSVECVGSSGAPPSYQLIEHDAVSCNVR